MYYNGVNYNNVLGIIYNNNILLGEPAAYLNKIDYSIHNCQNIQGFYLTKAEPNGSSLAAGEGVFRYNADLMIDNNELIVKTMAPRVYLNENCDGMFAGEYLEEDEYYSDLENLQINLDAFNGFDFKYVKNQSEFIYSVEIGVTGSPICGKNTVDLYSTYSDCYFLMGQPVCGPDVTDMSYTYYNCFHLTGYPVCGPNVTDMKRTYACCDNLTGQPVCGSNVTNMYYTYYYCYQLTGIPTCGENVTHMGSTYYKCFNLTGQPVCGNKVTNMMHTYYDCHSLTGQPVCGEEVLSMYCTYWNCTNLTGQPVCGENVSSMYRTYYNCQNLIGQPVYGNNVTNISSTYYNCKKLNGIPAISLVATGSMQETYCNCSNLIGQPVCGSNITSMQSTYSNCYNLTGSPVSKENVTIMYKTYANCLKLIGAPACGSNVNNMYWTYYNCPNLVGNLYIHSNNIGNVTYMLGKHNAQKRINIYVRPGTTSNSSLYSQGVCGSWTLETENNCYYNGVNNIYVYYNWDGSYNNYIYLKAINNNWQQDSNYYNGYLQIDIAQNSSVNANDAFDYSESLGSITRIDLSEVETRDGFYFRFIYHPTSNFIAVEDEGMGGQEFIIYEDPMKTKLASQLNAQMTYWIDYEDI